MLKPLRLILPALLASAAIAAEPVDDGHVREELGVNAYTSPAIGDVLDELRLLKPIPFGNVRRDPPAATFPNRAQLALNLGGCMADGFLIVATEKRTPIEPLARVLMRFSKAMGVSEKITRHGQSLAELAAHDRWEEVKTELVAMQKEVEGALMELRDEEISHLISLGGWLRGLQFTAETIQRDYSPGRSTQLVQHELIDYFLDRLRTLSPPLRKMELFQGISTRLQSVNDIVTAAKDDTLTKDQVREIARLAREMNEAIVKPVE
jgi:hypothetical protein